MRLIKSSLHATESPRLLRDWTTNSYQSPGRAVAAMNCLARTIDSAPATPEKSAITSITGTTDVPRSRNPSMPRMSILSSLQASTMRSASVESTSVTDPRSIVCTPASFATSISELTAFPRQVCLTALASTITETQTTEAIGEQTGSSTMFGSTRLGGTPCGMSAHEFRESNLKRRLCQAVSRRVVRSTSRDLAAEVRQAQPRQHHSRCRGEARKLTDCLDVFSLNAKTDSSTAHCPACRPTAIPRCPRPACRP
jgi:hypothetical protein